MAPRHFFSWVDIARILRGAVDLKIQCALGKQDPELKIRKSRSFYEAVNKMIALYRQAQVDCESDDRFIDGEQEMVIPIDYLDDRMDEVMQKLDEIMSNLTDDNSRFLQWLIANLVAKVVEQISKVVIDRISPDLNEVTNALEALPRMMDFLITIDEKSEETREVVTRESETNRPWYEQVYTWIKDIWDHIPRIGA